MYNDRTKKKRVKELRKREEKKRKYDGCVGTIIYLDRIGARLIRKLRYTLSYICTIGKDLEMENKNKKGIRSDCFRLCTRSAKYINRFRDRLKNTTSTRASIKYCESNIF